MRIYKILYSAWGINKLNKKFEFLNDCALISSKSASQALLSFENGIIDDTKSCELRVHDIELMKSETRIVSNDKVKAKDKTKTTTKKSTTVRKKSTAVS